MLGGANCNNGWVMNSILEIQRLTGKLLQLFNDRINHKGKLSLYILRQLASVMKLGILNNQDRLISTLVTIVK